jgi:ligand-binding sensor domain-containing protein
LKRIVLPLALAVSLTVGVTSAHAAGAWSTFLRPSSYGALIATADTVWCATEDAGLLYYARGEGQFTTEARQPGGLASNNLTALTFDRGGRLWIGTADAGVSRRASDGSWGVLNAFDGLPGLAVNALRAEGDSLWIATTAGLALYNGTEISGRLPDGAAPSPFASNNITGVEVLGDSVWVSTSAGVYFAQRSAQLATWTLMSTGLPASGRVDALASDGAQVWALASNQLWLAGAGSAWSLVPGWGAVYRVSDGYGQPLVTTNTGVFAYRAGAWTLLPNSPPSDGSPFTTYTATVDPAGTAFAASHSGLYEQQAPGSPWAQHFPPGPPGNNVQNVLVDGSRVYVATFDEGMGRFDGNNWTLWDPVPCTANCDHTLYDALYSFALLRDHSGQKWVGCWSVVVDRLDDSGPIDDVTHVLIPTTSSEIQHSWLWSAAADSDGGVWFGGDTNAFGSSRPEDQPIGIDYYSPSGIFRQNYQPYVNDSLTTMANVQVRSLAYDPNRDLMWVGYAGHGVQWFPLPRKPNGDTDTTGAKLPFHTIQDAARLDVFAVIPHSDSVWVFNTNDLRLYTAYGSTNNSVAYSIPAGPAPRGALHPLEVAADGTVWLGTANGIRVYHPGGATEDFNTLNSPLANDEVRTVRLDPATGAVWIATATGLNRFDPNYLPPPAPPLPFLQARVYPNPVPIANLIGTSLRITGNAPSYGGRVYGVDGRMVRRLTATTNGDLLWDGRDESGAQVRPGLYFVRIDAGGRQMTARVTLLR